MICRPTEQGWDIITQRHHALLAAKLLAEWKPEYRPQPWHELLNACSQHDHGWVEKETDALVDDQGRPVDFLHMPVEAAIAISQRSLRNAELISVWCAVLVAQHIEYLSSFKDDSKTQALKTEIQEKRVAWMSQLELSCDHLDRLYDLLKWADVLSLIVCCEPSDFTRSLELKAQGHTFSALSSGSDSWRLDPWPYRVDRLCLEYEVHSLPQARFSDNEALRRALSQASVVRCQLELHP